MIIVWHLDDPHNQRCFTSLLRGFTGERCFPKTVGGGSNVESNFCKCCFIWRGSLQFSLTKVLLYLDRLAGDHDSTPEGLRKAVTLKEAVRLHSACGAFLFCMEKLQAICPASDFPETGTWIVFPIQKRLSGRRFGCSP